MICIIMHARTQMHIQSCMCTHGSSQLCTSLLSHPRDPGYWLECIRYRFFAETNCICVELPYKNKFVPYQCEMRSWQKIQTSSSVLSCHWTFVISYPLNSHATYASALLACHWCDSTWRSAPSATFLSMPGSLRPGRVIAPSWDVPMAKMGVLFVWTANCGTDTNILSMAIFTGSMIHWTSLDSLLFFVAERSTCLGIGPNQGPQIEAYVGQSSRFRAFVPYITIHKCVATNPS